jgi:hypothetical protein
LELIVVVQNTWLGVWYLTQITQYAIKISQDDGLEPIGRVEVTIVIFLLIVVDLHDEYGLDLWFPYGMYLLDPEEWREEGQYLHDSLDLLIGYVADHIGCLHVHLLWYEA